LLINVTALFYIRSTEKSVNIQLIRNQFIRRGVSLSSARLNLKEKTTSSI